jgi:glycosyltransferase involved in cell wall biosynthesis
LSAVVTQSALLHPEPPAAAALKPVRRAVHVVHLLHTIAYGGVETIVLDWARSLDPRRVEVTVVCFANTGGTEGPFLTAAARAGLAVRTIPWGRQKPVLRSVSALIRLLRETGADVVHAHNLYAEFVGWIAARRVGAKVMSTLYVWSDFGWRRNLQQWIAARLLRRFDLVTSQCRMTMEDTIRRGVPRERQRLLVSGIRPVKFSRDPARRAEIRTANGCRSDDIVFVNVARLYPEKAQDRLLAWFRTVLDQRPNCKLWILGVGPLEQELKELARTLGVDRAVRFLGFIPDLPLYLDTADIQVHSSRAEGIPLAVCEGMAACLPIIATAVGGIPEVIEDGRTGLLVADGDGAGFVAGMLRLIDDQALRERLGAAARGASRAELSLEAAADRLAAMYEELAA